MQKQQKQQQNKHNTIDMSNENEVKIIFDEDLDTQQCTDLSSSLVNKDYFTQQLNNSNSQNTSNNLIKMPSSLIQPAIKIHDSSHKCSEEIDELQDGFSEILVDPKALQRRKMLSNNINLMAKSDVGFRVFNQEDDNNHSEIRSNSSLGSSMLNLSNSLIGCTSAPSKIDKILVDLDKFKIKVYDENNFEKGTQCCVCKSKFGLLSLRTHHCRFCSLSCCQYCSNKRINAQRACNMCFIFIAIETNCCQDDPYISSFKSQLEYQKKYEQLVEQQNIILANNILKLQKHSDHLSTKAWVATLHGKEKEKENAQILEETGAYLRDKLYDKNHLQQNMKNLKGILESKVNHLEEKKKVLYKLEQQHKRQKDDNLMKQQTLNIKQNKLNHQKQKKEMLVQNNQIDKNMINQQRIHSIIDPDSIIDSNYFNINHVDVRRTQSYYDNSRHQQIFQNELNDSTQPSFDQLQQQQKDKAQRCYSLHPNTDIYDGFQPITHHVAPKKKEKQQLCVNKCDFF